MNSTVFCFILSFCLPTLLTAQNVSASWVSDLGNGSYKNPVLHADYSDPDVCRVGDDYYMTASSFDAVPGLPILHSKDLVNWTLIGHALRRQVPIEHFEKTRHGNGVWAPAIRYHNNEFVIYYPDPDFGIYMVKSKKPEGPWDEPVLVEGGKGLIDPCPLWDDDGKNYLVHAYAGSRAGIKSVIAIKQLNAAGDKTIDEGKIVYDGHELDPTIEGPKIHKRNGYYYIFAPAGGVSTGWQTVLRSKSVYGPYERKVVMDQGETDVNGPHQGAWVDSSTGQDWFIHFQDKGAYGRVVHLQPMKWLNEWPVIGIDKNGDGKGEPARTFKKPDTGKTTSISGPAESDEFNSDFLGLQWQWQANPKAGWFFVGNGSLRLYSVMAPLDAKNLWDVPNILMQKFPAEEFSATVKITFKPNPKLDEKVGLIIMGQDYAGLVVSNSPEGIKLNYTECKDAVKGNPESLDFITKTVGTIYLRVTVGLGAKCRFSYSIDGKKFMETTTIFQAKQGKWIGAKVGLACWRTTVTNDSGFADVDWFRVDPR